MFFPVQQAMKNIFTIVILLAWLSSGCARTKQGYPGPERPYSEVATVTITSADKRLFLYLVQLDDQIMKVKPGDSVTCLPGEHTMRIKAETEAYNELYFADDSAVDPAGPEVLERKIEYKDIIFSVEPGRTYELDGRLWRNVVWTWITDVATGERSTGSDPKE
jgi:hypothetical protein